MALADYINDKPTIETERLILRPMAPSDIPALRTWMPDEKIYIYWGKGPGKAEKNPELMFEKKKKPARSFHLGIAGKEDNRVIGDLWVYLIENDRMASVAIRLAGSCQGRGYGTESLSAITEFCFEHTELRRLWTGVDIRIFLPGRCWKNAVIPGKASSARGRWSIPGAIIIFTRS